MKHKPILAEAIRIEQNPESVVDAAPKHYAKRAVFFSLKLIMWIVVSVVFSIALTVVLTAISNGAGIKETAAELWEKLIEYLGGRL